MESDYPPEDALRDAQAARAALAERLNAPAGYHPLRAATVALAISTFGIDFHRHLALRLVLCAVVVAAFLALFVWYHHATGVAAREGAGGGWRFGFLLMLFVGAEAERWFATEPDDNWPVVIGVAAVCGAVVWIMGLREDDAVRQRVRSGEKEEPQK